MNIILCCCSLSSADIIGIVGLVFSFLMLFVTGLIFWVGRNQLNDFKKTKQIEFTFQVDADFHKFLEAPENKKVKDWLLNDLELSMDSDEDRDSLRQLFDKIEAIDVLRKQNVINMQVFYDLLSEYVESIFDNGKTPTAKEFIAEEIEISRKLEHKNPEDIYSGVISLNDWIKNMN
jgi:hypothetical protein